MQFPVVVYFKGFFLKIKLNLTFPPVERGISLGKLNSIQENKQGLFSREKQDRRGLLWMAQRLVY